MHSITKEYKDGLAAINSHQRTRQSLVDKHPWWNDLDALLSTRPEFQVDDVLVLDDDDEDDGAARAAQEDDEDRMSGESSWSHDLWCSPNRAD